MLQQALSATMFSLMAQHEPPRQLLPWPVSGACVHALVRDLFIQFKVDVAFTSTNTSEECGLHSCGHLFEDKKWRISRSLNADSWSEPTLGLARSTVKVKGKMRV